MKAVRESQRLHGLYAEEEPYSGTGHLLGEKVRICYEIIPDLYVSDLFKVAKRAAKVLKNFSPKVLVFSVGLKDLILGLDYLYFLFFPLIPFICFCYFILLFYFIFIFLLVPGISILTTVIHWNFPFIHISHFLFFSPYSLYTLEFPLYIYFT